MENKQKLTISIRNLTSSHLSWNCFHH